MDEVLGDFEARCVRLNRIVMEISATCLFAVRPAGRECEVLSVM